MTAAIELLLDEGAAKGVYDSARVAVFQRGSLLFDIGKCPEETFFDLASITKVMVTTPLVVEAIKNRELKLTDSVRHFFPQASVDATIEDLLYHRAGLPALVHFFPEALTKHPDLQKEDCDPALRRRARAEIIDAAWAIEPQTKIAEETIYCDVGFIWLTAVVEKIFKNTIDVAFETHVAHELGLMAKFSPLTHKIEAPLFFAPTGQRRPRDADERQKGKWNLPQVASRSREVDDDNAWVMNGISGHAGLFATAFDVASYGNAILNGAFTLKEKWLIDPLTPNSTRTFGFDTVSREGSSLGIRLGRGPMGAIGHLGYTGTSLWVDFDNELSIAFLSNRTFLTRDKVENIRALRPRIHDAIAKEILG